MQNKITATVFFLLSVIACFVYGDDAAIRNEYYQKKEVQKLIDDILQRAGGEEAIRQASVATYEALVNMNLPLMGLKVSYKQVIKKDGSSFRMENDILGDTIVTGFDGKDLYQSAYEKLFQIPEYKANEIKFVLQSSMPHQFVLKLKQRDYALKFLGTQKIENKEMFVFQHTSELGEEKHCFDVATLQPILSISSSLSTGLQWEVTRDFFKQQDSISYPVMIRMKLNQEELYQMTILSINFLPIDHKEFQKPKLANADVVLQPFAGQVRLKEIYQALELLREYDPVNRSYPLPEKVRSMMGVRPQLGNPSRKIGHKKMFTYELYRGAVAEQLELETYPYLLQGNNIHKFTPLVWDKQGNYKGGRNVLFADGSIQFLSEMQFNNYLQTSLKRYPVIKAELEKE